MLAPLYLNESERIMGLEAVLANPQPRNHKLYAERALQSKWHSDGLRDKCRKQETTGGRRYRGGGCVQGSEVAGGDRKRLLVMCPLSHLGGKQTVQNVFQTTVPF